MAGFALIEYVLFVACQSRVIINVRMLRMLLQQKRSGSKREIAKK